MSDSGKSDDSKRRQDFPSMHHGILLIVPPVVAKVVQMRLRPMRLKYAVATVGFFAFIFSIIRRTEPRLSTAG